MEGTWAHSAGGFVRVKGSTHTPARFGSASKGQRGELYARHTLRPAPKQTIKLLSPATKSAKFCSTLLWAVLFVGVCWCCALVVDQCLSFIWSRLIYRVHGKPVVWFIQRVTRLRRRDGHKSDCGEEDTEEDQWLAVISHRQQSEKHEGKAKTALSQDNIYLYLPFRHVEEKVPTACR